MLNTTFYGVSPGSVTYGNQQTGQTIAPKRINVYIQIQTVTGDWTKVLKVERKSAALVMAQEYVVHGCWIEDDTGDYFIPANTIRLVKVLKGKPK